MGQANSLVVNTWAPERQYEKAQTSHNSKEKSYGYENGLLRDSIKKLSNFGIQP